MDVMLPDVGEKQQFAKKLGEFQVRTASRPCFHLHPSSSVLFLEERVACMKLVLPYVEVDSLPGRPACS